MPPILPDTGILIAAGLKKAAGKMIKDSRRRRIWYHFSGHVSHLLFRQPQKTVWTKKAHTIPRPAAPGILICMNQEK